jgi:hypothetical protein
MTMLHGTAHVLRAYQDWKIRLLQQAHDRSIRLGVDTPTSPVSHGFRGADIYSYLPRDYTHRYETPRVVNTFAFARLPIALASSIFVTVPSESPVHRQTAKTSAYSYPPTFQPLYSQP